MKQNKYRIFYNSVKLIIHLGGDRIVRKWIFRNVWLSLILAYVILVTYGYGVEKDYQTIYNEILFFPL